MKTCPNCSDSWPDSTESCYSCDTALPSAEVVQEAREQEEREQVEQAREEADLKSRGFQDCSPDTIALLDHDAEEGFDLETLNALRITQIESDIQNHSKLRAAIDDKVVELLNRLIRESREPSTIAAILRQKTVDWYQQSPELDTWAKDQWSRWGGLFHESRIPGGQMRSSLENRLKGLLRALDETKGGLLSGIGKKKKRRIPWAGVTATEPLLAPVSQALLDDLSATVRSEGEVIPLVNLNQLTTRYSTKDLVRVLKALFGVPFAGLFVILDPKSYPDIDLVGIMPPSDTSESRGAAFGLVCLDAKGLGLAQPEIEVRVAQAQKLILAGSSGPQIYIDQGVAQPTEVAQPTGGIIPQPPAPQAATPGQIAAQDLDEFWNLDDLAPEDCATLLAIISSKRQRLKQPPRGARNNPIYLSLREAILIDKGAAQNLYKARWRGKPVGILLLAKLLAFGSMVPEETTDNDYLMAEMGDLERGDTEYRPEDGQWQVGEHAIKREVDERRITYRIV